MSTCDIIICLFCFQVVIKLRILAMHRRSNLHANGEALPSSGLILRQKLSQVNSLNLIFEPEFLREPLAP
jgi:hypothetical protein